MQYIKLNYIEIKQNIGTFFLCKMTPKQLHSVANSDLSRYSDTEKGIQRDISKARTKEIEVYLKNNDATFPNTIIICVSDNPANTYPFYELDTKAKILSILSEKGVANILDGQHRLSGLSEDNTDFELPVAIFLDLSLGEQAKIFSKINSTQTKVSLDLVYDLFGMVEERSVEKSSYAIVKSLNSEETSPWYKKIKTLTERKGDLAQGSFAKYIDKELIGSGKILENLFKENRDKDLLTMLNNFFTGIKNVFPDEWENIPPLFILTKTTGFVGCMSFFKDLIKIARHQKKGLTLEFCESKIISSKDYFLKLDSVNYESGAKGQNKIRDILRKGLTEEEKVIIGIK